MTLYRQAAALIRTKTPVRFVLETLALALLMALWGFAPLGLMLAIGWLK
jgi:hypothetical protein